MESTIPRTIPSAMAKTVGTTNSTAISLWVIAHARVDLPRSSEDVGQTLEALRRADSLTSEESRDNDCRGARRHLAAATELGCDDRFFVRNDFEKAKPKCAPNPACSRTVGRDQLP